MATPNVPAVSALPGSDSVIIYDPNVSKGWLQNYTPHPVHILGKYGNTLVFMPVLKGKGARCAQAEQKTLKPATCSGEIDEIDVVEEPRFLDVEDLPPGQEVIVSMPVAQRLKETGYDGVVYSPDTSPAGSIRDDQGKILGTKRLVLWKCKKVEL